MKRAVDLAFRMQKWLWTLFRPNSRGVKVLLFNDAGELMLIRNSYGRSDLFVLPGGGIRPWEAPEKAALREIREELGCLAAALHPVSTHFSDAEGKRDTIHLFSAKAQAHSGPTISRSRKRNSFRSMRFRKTFPPRRLRRIEERLGKRMKDGTW